MPRKGACRTLVLPYPTSAFHPLRYSEPGTRRLTHHWISYQCLLRWHHPGGSSEGIPKTSSAAGQGYIAAEATHEETGKQKRAAIVIGPEYGTVGQELVHEAARECRDWADALIVCGFAFDPQVGETTMNLGRLVVLKARMSQELHAAEAYKSGGGNLFVVFGEPDIALDRDPDGTCTIHLRGVDIFDPTTGEVRSSGKVEDDVACWFIDTDYDGDSFFVRHAYFLGGKDPYEKLKSALKAEIDPDAWSSLYSTESRAFPAPRSGRIAVKVINHYGDEALRVFRIP